MVLTILLLYVFATISASICVVSCRFRGIFVSSFELLVRFRLFLATVCSSVKQYGDIYIEKSLRLGFHSLCGGLLSEYRHRLDRVGGRFYLLRFLVGFGFLRSL